MGDKELVEVWRKQFESGYENHSVYGFEIRHGEYIDDDVELHWLTFLMAKRSQPSVVLPNNAEINHLAVDTAGEYDWNTIEAKEKYTKAFTDGALMICDDIARNLTAAGIKYTIGE